MSIYIGTNLNPIKSIYLSIGSEWGVSTSLGSTITEPLPDELTELGLQRGKTYKIKEIYVGNTLRYRDTTPFLPDGTNGTNGTGNYSASNYLMYSSGSPYINTGIIGGLNSSRTSIKVEMEVELSKSNISSTTDVTLLGARSGNTRFYMVHYYNNKFCIGYGDSLQYPNQTITDNLQKYLIVSEFTNGSQTLEVRKFADNTVISGTKINGTVLTAYDTNLNMFLFATNYGGTANYINKVIRIGNCKIYVNGELKKSFTPCSNKNTGVYGMYDLVNREFYTTPTGSFVGTT